MNEENNVNQENSSDQQVQPDQPLEQPQPAQEAAAVTQESVPQPPQSPYETAPVQPAPAPAPAPEGQPVAQTAAYTAADAAQAQPPVQPVQPTEPQQPVATYPQQQPTQAYQTPVQAPGQATQPQQTYPTYGTQPVEYATQQQAQNPYYAQPAPVQPSNGKAMGALICGILAILFSGTVIVGIILGIIAIVLAVQYAKSFGKDSKATGGKICGIVGIVFSVIAAISWAFLIWAGIMFVDSASEYYDDYSYEYTYPEEDDSTSGGISGYGDLVDEAEAVQEFDKVMGQVKTLSDEELLGKIAKQYNDDLQDWYGITLTDMGIDPKEVIQVSLDGITYELDSYSSYSYSSGDELTLDGYVACTDGYDVLMAFSDKLYDKDIYSSDLSSEDMTMIKELYLEAVKEASPSYDTYVWFDFEKNESGEWVVDPDSFEDAIESMFSIY